MRMMMMEDSNSLDLIARIVLQCSEPDDVVALIRRDYANQYFRLWRIADRGIADSSYTMPVASGTGTSMSL